MPGDKSVKRPARNKPARVTSATAMDRGYVRFRAVDHRPFRAQSSDQDAANEVLDMVSDAILDLDTLRFRAVDRAVVLATFVEPYEARSCGDAVA